MINSLNKIIILGITTDMTACSEKRELHDQFKADPVHIDNLHGRIIFEKFA